MESYETGQVKVKVKGKGQMKLENWASARLLWMYFKDNICLFDYKILQNSTPTSCTTTRPYPSAARITKSVRAVICVPKTEPLDVKDKCNDSLLYQHS